MSSRDNGEKFRIRAYLVYVMLALGTISVTLLTALGRTDANTYEKIMGLLLAYVAGWASSKVIDYV